MTGPGPARLELAPDGLVEGRAISPEDAAVDQVVVDEHEGMEDFQAGRREGDGSRRGVVPAGHDPVTRQAEPGTEPFAPSKDE